jgi:hypothetical protein
MLPVVQSINAGSGGHLISQTSPHTTYTTVDEFEMTSRTVSVATHLCKAEFLVAFDVNVASCHALPCRGNEITSN